MRIASALTGLVLTALTASLLKLPAANATVYFSDARRGQSDTYLLLTHLFHKNNPWGRIIQMSFNTTEMRLDEMKSGDILLLNMYSEHPLLHDVKYLAQLSAKGVDILLDLEVTGSQHFPTLQRRKNLTPVHFLAGSKEVADYLKTLNPELAVTPIPHLETLYYLKPTDKAEAALTHARENPSERRILIAHQYPKHCVEFMEKFFAELDSKPHEKTQIILALHPHTKDDQIAKLTQLYGSRPDVQIIHSTGGIKTNELLPLVDGVVSHSSTLGDVAKSSGLPVLDGMTAPGAQGAIEFVNRLDPLQRTERQARMKSLAEETFAVWNKILKDPPLVHARACAKIFTLP